MFSVIFIIFAIITPNFATADYVYYPEVNVFYKFHMTPLKWAEARLKCISENAILALPKNEAEAEVLKRLFEEYPASRLHKVEEPDYLLLRFHDMFDENEYLTDEGISLQYFYHKWMSRQPDNNINEDCGSMHRSGEINDFPCDKPSVFVCQKERVPYINDLKNNIPINRDPAYVFDPKSKKRFKFHTTPRTWNQARVICQSEGGQLANIGSKQEEDFLVNMMNDPINKIDYITNKNFAFLGFHNYFDKDNYVTTSGKPLSNLGYVRWKPHTLKSEIYEQCGSMDSQGALHDLSCSYSAVFFCEIKTSEDFSNRDDYSFYPEVGVWYKVYGRALNWADARYKCLEEGATLAMPKNLKEMNILKYLMEENKKSKNDQSDCLWLGFHDIFEENDYISEIGHPLQYYFNEWKVNQPDNYDEEDCLCMVDTGNLNDWGCHNNGIFICQKEKMEYLKGVSSYNLQLDPMYLLEPNYNKRFKLHLTPRTWNQARVICKAEGGQLANVANDVEKRFLIVMFNHQKPTITGATDKNLAYLGFHDQFQEGKYFTTEGKLLNVTLKSVDSSDCGIISMINENIDQTDCKAKLVYFCELTPQ